MTAVINTLFGEVEVETKFCKKCKLTLPITDFRARGEGSGVMKRLYTSCKSCEKKYHETLSRLHKQAPPKPDLCDCCGKKIKRLHLEHCHATNKIRGWTCENCNTSIGRAGDNLNGILNILKYMVERGIDDSLNENKFRKIKGKTYAYIKDVKNCLSEIESG